MVSPGRAEACASSLDEKRACCGTSSEGGDSLASRRQAQNKDAGMNQARRWGRTRRNCRFVGIRQDRISQLVTEHEAVDDRGGCREKRSRGENILVVPLAGRCWLFTFGRAGRGWMLQLLGGAQPTVQRADWRDMDLK